MKHKLIPRIKSLRSFIIFAIICAVILTVLPSGLIFYVKSSDTLTEIYRKDIVRQLEQINLKVQEQIEIIDSLFPQLLSNTIIRDNIDPSAQDYPRKTATERRLNIERQMSYLLVSTYPWSAKLINAVYIFDNAGECAAFSLYENTSLSQGMARASYDSFSRSEPSLMITRPAEGANSIYFTRNIHSSNTGEWIAAILIDVNESEWIQSYNGGGESLWTTFIYNDELRIGSDAEAADIIRAAEIPGPLERSVNGKDYFIASQKMSAANLTSVAAAKKQDLFLDLNNALETFLLLYLSVILLLFIFSLLLSYAVTRPIKKMIAYVGDVAKSRGNISRPFGLFTEFDDFADAFSEMLEKLRSYYNDLYHQELLLKNAEIKALQAQIDPHFLFNILNTVAWKAQMGGNEEIYKMTISIGELLRANILSKDKDFVSLAEELSYARLYIYLQKERFEDKFEAEIFSLPELDSFTLPRFCIQPLIENAICHGLEPMTELGRLIVNISGDSDEITVSVKDNGCGFPADFELDSLRPSLDGEHSHIGLNNLNRRLALLYGGENVLNIRQEGGMTEVSFKLRGERRL